MGSQKRMPFELAQDINTPNFTPKCQGPLVTLKTRSETKNMFRSMTQKTGCLCAMMPSHNWKQAHIPDSLSSLSTSWLNTTAPQRIWAARGVHASELYPTAKGKIFRSILTHLTVSTETWLITNLHRTLVKCSIHWDSMGLKY